MGGLSNLASVGVNLALSQQAQRREDQRLRNEREKQLSDLRDKALSAEQDVQAALRRRLAAARARAGASGIATTGGSIDAITRGLEQQASDDLTALGRDAARRADNIRQQASTGRRRSLLDFTSRLSGIVAGGSKRRSLLG